MDSLINFEAPGLWELQLLLSEINKKGGLAWSLKGKKAGEIFYPQQGASQVPKPEVNRLKNLYSRFLYVIN
jgi:hypothetical protein